MRMRLRSEPSFRFICSSAWDADSLSPVRVDRLAVGGVALCGRSHLLGAGPLLLPVYPAARLLLVGSLKPVSAAHHPSLYLRAFRRLPARSLAWCPKPTNSSLSRSA